METSKGDIVVELLINETPLSVANFISLIRQGFYTNKSFHRVVQNFVAQGGCPRGDGWGSSPDLIRSEFTQRGYETGVLGLASAGKDTESCQWFFTHCPTPHLDGRYTIFGKIIIGQYVIDQLEIGDKIKKIEVLDN
ncbi:MAG: peptidylprolyl isomerase [Cytophagales bacterium]|nr:MAG: peptidylprolyl isomerase [Cytophagales bacterium]TAF59518.1 MAG: peptidylprolyl isomerase [Cytophagales bacterium]